MHVVSNRDIQAGEELEISYIETEGVPLKQRRIALENYRFDCACPRCSAEAEAERSASEIPVKKRKGTKAKARGVGAKKTRK